MKRTIITIIILIIVTIGIIFAVNATRNIDKEQPPAPTSDVQSIQKGDKVFGSFKSVDVNNNPVDSNVFAGKKLTMVNIWATFCGPCINEMPDLAVLNSKYAEKGFQVIGIISDVSDANGNISKSMLDTAKMIIKKTGANYMHILPSQSLIQAKLNNVTAVPETVFIDENGNQIGESYVGSRSEDQWSDIINSLLEEVK